MNDEPCVLSVNGINYYTACDVIDDIVYIDDYLVNTSNSSITLYRNYPTYGDSTTGYPRIQANANQKFYYRSSYSANATSLTVGSFGVVNRHTSNDFLLMIVLIGVMILNLFKR